MADARFEAEHPRGGAGRFAAKPRAGRSRAAEAGLRQAASPPEPQRFWEVELVEGYHFSDDEVVLFGWRFPDEESAERQAELARAAIVGVADHMVRVNTVEVPGPQDPQPVAVLWSAWVPSASIVGDAIRAGRGDAYSSGRASQRFVAGDAAADLGLREEEHGDGTKVSGGDRKAVEARAAELHAERVAQAEAAAEAADRVFRSTLADAGRRRPDR